MGTTRGARLTLVVAALFALLACVEMPRQRVDALPDRGYPSCAPDAPTAAPIQVEGALRAGPVMREQSVVESFSIHDRGCHVVYTGHEEWSMGATDLEIVLDAERRPQRIYRRFTAPGGQEPARRTQVSVFDLRGEHVELTRRSPTGELERLLYRAPTPGVVIATGRGVLSLWLQRAHLAVGGRVREPALDIRESVEVVRDVTLARLEDRDDARLGRVRVYTIYGREPVYADENDVVVGDMMGLVPAAMVSAPLAPPTPTDGPPRPEDPFGR
jgi:hypothetical protein